MRWKKFISGALAAGVLAAGALMPVQAAEIKENEHTLQFKQDGTLKVMCLADPQDTNTPTRNLMRFYTDLLDTQKPDVVILTGDQIKGYAARFHWGDTERKVREAIDALISPLVERGIEFAVVFGNHDDELFGKEEQMAMYMSYPGCLAIDEGEALSGCGTYNVPVLSADGSRMALNLCFFDSQVRAEEENGGYGYVKQDQLDWYVQKSEALKAQNGGTAVPSLVFQHIIVPEAYEMLTEVPKDTPGAVRGSGIRNTKYYLANPDYIRSGALREGPCPSNINGGQFETMRQQGDVIAMFFGHDHDNSFLGTYEGIDLVALPGAAFADYGQKDTRAVRFLTLHENDPRGYETQVISFLDYYGDTFQTNLNYYLFTTREFAKIAKWAGIAAAVLAAGTVAGLVARRVKKKKVK